jgi:hypothetical protein
MSSTRFANGMKHRRMPGGGGGACARGLVLRNSHRRR